MLSSEPFIALLNKRIGFVLDAAEIGLSPEAFKVFRRIVLKQFGSDELGTDIEGLLAQAAKGLERTGQGRS